MRQCTKGNNQHQTYGFLFKNEHTIQLRDPNIDLPLGEAFSAQPVMPPAACTKFEIY